MRVRSTRRWRSCSARLPKTKRRIFRRAAWSAAEPVDLLDERAADGRRRERRRGVVLRIGGTALGQGKRRGNSDDGEQQRVKQFHDVLLKKLREFFAPATKNHRTRRHDSGSRSGKKYGTWPTTNDYRRIARGIDAGW